jgi:hypothetical protein
MTLQHQINEYRQKQDALYAAAEECAQKGDIDGFTKNMAEAFFMLHPVTAMLRDTKETGFFGGTEMQMPFKYGGK